MNILLYRPLSLRVRHRSMSLLWYCLVVFLGMFTVFMAKRHCLSLSLSLSFAHWFFLTWPIFARSFSYEFLMKSGKILHILLCPICNIGSFLWIFLMWGTGDNQHRRVCHAYYRQVSNIRRTLAGNKFVDHSDVVGASHVGAAPTTSSFST